ncbi:ABC-F family ATP-binding cassette domain-containing protein [Guggenheimella bovis]
MSILTVKNLNHGFGSRTIFTDVNFRLLPGEHVGLIGANGEGKSTFFNLITKKIEPDSGQIEWSSRVRAGYLDQSATLEPKKSIRDTLRDAFHYLYDYEDQILKLADSMATLEGDKMDEALEEMGTLQDLLDHHGFYEIDVKIERVAKGLGLTELGLDNPASEQSGGQRAKILLAKLLLEEPEILLLDEPTNHLDEEHVNWLKEYLKAYENAFILISHDRSFMNDVANLIYHVEDSYMTRYVGNLDSFEAQYALQKEQLQAQYEKQQQEIAHLEEFIARNKARIATSNMAKSRQKKLDNMEIIELGREKPKPVFHFEASRLAGSMIFETKDLVIGYTKPLTKPLSLSMRRGEKLALVGANGIGKTTLLKSLLGLIKPLSGSVKLGDHLDIGYFEQELRDIGSDTCIEYFWKEFPGYSQYEVRSALAKCGLTTKHIESQVRILSGGEQAKVRLAILVNKPNNILILDEPTNHLDQDAKDALQQALKDYNGSILLVSHERDFFESIVEREINCNQWK